MVISFAVSIDTSCASVNKALCVTLDVYVPVTLRANLVTASVLTLRLSSSFAFSSCFLMVVFQGPLKH